MPVAHPGVCAYIRACVGQVIKDTGQPIAKLQNYLVNHQVYIASIGMYIEKCMYCYVHHMYTGESL